MTDGAGGTHKKIELYTFVIETEIMDINQLAPIFTFFFFIPLLNFRNFLYDIIN